MELELLRHDWDSLESPFSDAATLPDLIRGVCTGPSDDTRRLARDGLQRVLPVDQPVSEATVAATAALVQGLVLAGTDARGLILGLLADFAAGRGEEDDVDVVRSPAFAALAAELTLGFGCFVELLNVGPTADIRYPCIDLVTACGAADARLRHRATDYLTAVRTRPEFSDFDELIDDCLRHLREGVSD